MSRSSRERWVFRVLGRVKDVRRTIGDAGDLLPDGTMGAVTVRPNATMEEAFDARLIVGQKRRAEFAAMRDLPALTTDGLRIELMVNAGLRDDMAALDVTGADGVGLFRTEFQFLVSATFPAARAPASPLSRSAGFGGRSPGDLPHGRYRRRQGAALYEHARSGGRRESGTWLACASSGRSSATR